MENISLKMEHKAERKDDKAKRSFSLIKDNMELLLLTLPALAAFFIFSYMPMYGTIVAFKNYNYVDGIAGSKWVGLKNFTFFFTSQDAWRVTRNTLGYGLLFIVAGTLCSIVIALLVYEISERKFLCKVYQTAMTLPRFMSWVVVGYITYILLDPVKGIGNMLLTSIGIEPVMWYMNSKYWPFILLITNLWKGAGMGSLIYYATLMGIDVELYEAAKLDGASRAQQTRYITIPGLIPVTVILFIMGIGHIFKGDFGLFYTIPMNIGMLYPTTDILDTYVFRGLQMGGDIGITSAVGLTQSVVGLVMVLLTNAIVKKISPEHVLF